METGFRFNGTLQDRIRSYGEYVAASMDMIEHAATDPLSFACESALISGEDPDRIPWPGKYKEYQEVDMPWITEFKINDVMLADSCIKSRGRRGNILDPVIINMPLCRNRQYAKWRTSTYLGTRTGFPAPNYAKELVRRWQRVVMVGARSLAGASKRDRIVFAWTMHDAFICIQPFKDGNERTARLLLQVIRRELDLEPVFISRDDMTLHRERIRLFRKEVFMPLMRKYKYISDM
ncbi:MAG: Fic family protein [Minisyncoccia bacterium]